MDGDDSAAGDAGNDAAIAAAWQVARAAWPAVALERARFAAFVADKRAAGPGVALCLDDLYLACACSDGDPAALAAFDRDLAATIDHAVGTVGATAAERADVAQIVRARLLVTDGARAPRI